tara:strand:+ start:967 stop:2673 length:1707 start_codon:yes stop_codon:yes gene_type:complete
MANGFLPFPTFGGEKSPGIMSVQLPTSPVRFPTASRRGATAPASVSPMASLAPGILALLSQNIFKPEEIIAPEPTDADLQKTYTLEDIRRELEDPQQAEFAAQQIYGPGGKLTRGQKVGRYLLENAPALFFDDPRELAAYMGSSKTVGDLRTAQDLSRQEFIGDYRTALAGKVLNVTPAYDVETGVARNAIEGPNGGFYIQSIGRDEDKTIDGTAVEKGEYYRNPKWIIGEPARDNTSLIASKRNIDNDFKTERNKLEAIASNLRSSVPMMTDIIETVAASPEITTWWEPFTRFGGQAKSFIDTYNEGKDEKLHLADDRSKNTWYDQTTGRPTEKFLQGKALPYQEEIWDVKSQTFKTVTKTMDLTAMFGDLGNNAEFRSAMINMAYLAAAANGQTGRTLSDKDLALHLQQLGATFGGGGGIKTPEASIRALTSWYHNQLEVASVKMQELERSSMASDWRRDNPNELTPWAEQYLSPLTEGKDNRTQKLFKLPQTWNNQQDADWLKYLNVLAIAKAKFGSTAIPDDPIKGFDWYNNIFVPYSDALRGGATTEDGITIPEEKKPGRTGV